MTTRTVPCRVCGNAFVPCNKPSSALGAFNYHAVACSPECGAEYLRRVQESRKQFAPSDAPDANASTSEFETAAVEAVAVSTEEQESGPIVMVRPMKKQRKAARHGGNAENQ